MAPEPNAIPQEFYSLSNADTQHAYVGVRRAVRWIGFFLPHLHPGFSVLDCGCGLGSITLDIAERVAPGQVVGIDTDADQLAVARNDAAERGVSNVSFRHGNVYALDFEDGVFDAVLAHTLLFHLSEPVRALKEIRRVLKPGGVAAVSDDDLQTLTYSPEHALMQKALHLWVRVIQHNGANPYYSRHLRSLFSQAGFAGTAGHAVAADYYGTGEETRRFSTMVTFQFRDPALTSLVTTRGWATQAELDEIVDFVQDWGERPDSFLAVMYCACVGWK